MQGQLYCMRAASIALPSNNLNLKSDWTWPNPVARTTRMHGHQTPLSLRLGGVACETKL